MLMRLQGLRSGARVPTCPLATTLVLANFDCALAPQSYKFSG